VAGLQNRRPLIERQHHFLSIIQQRQRTGARVDRLYLTFDSFYFFYQVWRTPAVLSLMESAAKTKLIEQKAGQREAYKNNGQGS